MKKYPTTKQEAIDYFGSVSEMAKRLNVTTQNIYQYKEILTETLQERIILRMLIDKHPEVNRWINKL